MAYRLKPNYGESIAVPQLVFSRLDTAGENALRAALYIISTGVTDPGQIAAALKLRSVHTAESLLQWWCGAGLLEATEVIPEPVPKAAPLTFAEIAEASMTDPALAGLIQCAQQTLGGSLSHRDTQLLAGLYLQQGYDPEVLLLVMSYISSLGKRTVGAVAHEAAAWRAAGIETGEQADRHLALLEQRQAERERVAAALGTTTEALTLGQKKAIDRWQEEYGYGAAMIDEAILQAGSKKDVWYVNKILQGWYGRGLRTPQDVRGSGAVGTVAGRNIAVSRELPHTAPLPTETARQDTMSLPARRPHRLKREE